MLQKLAMLRNRARRQQVKTMKTRTLNSPSVMVLITKRLKVRVKQQHACTAPSNMHAVQQNQKQRQKVENPAPVMRVVEKSTAAALRQLFDQQVLLVLVYLNVRAP